MNTSTGVRSRDSGTAGTGRLASGAARRTPLLLTLSAVSLLLAACAQGSAPTSGGESASFGPGSTLTIRTDGPWDTFDPSIGANLPTGQLAAPLYDRLVWEGADHKVVPYLATSWQQSPTSLKFNLRRGVTCSDGTPLTPTVIAQSFDKLLGISNPKTRSTSIVGEFGPGPFSVSADDSAGTFTINLGTPFGQALDSLGSVGTDAVVICPKGLAAGASRDAAYGSGPYTLASQDRATGATFKLRSDWSWGPNGKTARGLPGTLVYKIVTNETTAANLLLTSGLDIARIQGADVKRLLADKTVGSNKTSSFYTNPLWLNPEPGHVTADKAVREAIFYAVSADAWNQAAYGGFGTVTTSLWATTAPCFAPQSAQYVPKTVDLAKAKSILLADGYAADSSGKLSKNGQPLTITLIGATEQAAGPEYIDTQLVQLGMTVNFVNTDHVTYSSSWLQPGKFDVLVPGIASDLVGAYILFYSGSDPPAGRNFSRVHDPEIDSLVQKAEQEVGSQACADWANVQIDILKNYYDRPLVAQSFYWFSRNPKWKFFASTSVLMPWTLG